MELATCCMCGLDKVTPTHEINIGVGILTGYGSRTCEDCVGRRKKSNTMEWIEVKKGGEFPKSTKEFLVKNENQGGVMSLVYFNKMHGHFLSKGKYVSEVNIGTHYLLIPKHDEIQPDTAAERDRLKAEKELFEEENAKMICEGAKVMHERDRLKLKNAELAEALTRIADGFDGYNSEDWQAIVKENRQVAKDALSSHHAKGLINH